MIAIGPAGTFQAPSEKLTRPPMGTAWVICPKRKCHFVHREHDRPGVEESGKESFKVWRHVCPKCGCTDYYFATDKEIAKAGGAK